MLIGLVVKRKSWSDAERAAVFRHLEAFIVRSVLPGQLHCCPYYYL